MCHDLLLDSTHTVVCVLGGEKDRTVSTLENDLTLNYIRDEEMKFIFFLEEYEEIL